MKFDREKYLKDLEELVNTDSGSFYPEGLETVADILVKKYKDAGFYTFLGHSGENNRPYVAAYTKKEEETGGQEKPIDIMLFGHFDTVFSDGTAAERPFTVDEEKAYGPGVADMKSGVLLGLYLADALKKKHPGISIGILNNGDEEIGSIDSHHVLLDFAGKSKYAFDMEPGRISGNFVKCRKGGGEYMVKCYGVSAHAGNAPQKGASAICEAARCVEELHALNDYEGGTTVNVGIIKGGSASNSVPDYCEMIVDVRYWTDEQRVAVEEKIWNIGKKVRNKSTRVDVHRMSSAPPMLEIPQTQKMVDVMEEEARKLSLSFGFEKSGGMSDASFVSEAGVPVIDACGPCGDFLHSEKEYIVLDTIEERFYLLFNTIERLLGYQ